MRSYDFTLILKGVVKFDRHLMDALYESGCDDGNLALSNGRPQIRFSRESKSLKEAIVSAIRDVRSAGVEVLRVDLEEMVCQSDIARLTGKSRQHIHQLIKGLRGPGTFPAPLSRIKSKPVWAWHEVVLWFAENKIVPVERVETARTIGAINCLLNLSHYGAKLSKTEFSRITGHRIKLVR